MSLTWETFPCNNLLSKAMVIHVGLVIIISPWKKTFEETCLIYTKEALFHVLLNLTQWFCRKKDFQISQILLIHVSPLRKRYTPSFEQTWIPFTKGYFELKLVVICPLFLEKKIYNTKGGDRFHWAATPPKPYTVGNIWYMTYNVWCIILPKFVGETFFSHRKRQFLWKYPNPETVIVPCFNVSRMPNRRTSQSKIENIVHCKCISLLN